jgi:signal transduction histidine kinase
VAERTRELRALAHHLEAVREGQRTRIAREIHDEPGSLLVALKMDTQWLDRRLADRPQLQCKCHGMGRLIDTAVDKVGRIITDPRPSILDHQGPWAALEWQAQEFIESSELDATLQVHVAARVPPPEGGMAIAVFRISQEMPSNVARHAQARSLRIAITVDDPPDPVLYLDVRDEGVGALAAPMVASAQQTFNFRMTSAYPKGVAVLHGRPGLGHRPGAAHPGHVEQTHPHPGVRRGRTDSGAGGI